MIEDGNNLTGGIGFVDIHCHCLAGIDDGPAVMSDALALCRALSDDGITTVVATPHQLGRYDMDNDCRRIIDLVNELNDVLVDNKIELTVLPGADVRLDERICELIDSDVVMTIADGRKYILLELPGQVLIDIEPLLKQLSEMGISAVITHPERHNLLIKDISVISRWFEYSVHLQITAGSLLGWFGKAAQKAAWDFLYRGLVTFVATDAHDLEYRRPCMSIAFAQIAGRMGTEAAKELCIQNPTTLIRGQKLKAANGKRTTECCYELAQCF